MASTEILRDEGLREEVARRVFPSGLTVYACRKRDFTRSYATVAARYGSIDTHLDGKRLPDGIAHFLEHKVFETPEGDAFDLFAARGASANAFTSFGSTRYLFGTSTDFRGNLRILLEMVFQLQVTDAGVEKERGIIGQEIAMYDDDPDWRIYFGALGALYARHPVRTDIAGTKKSIAGITAPLLSHVHRRLYHPRNMTLAAVSPEPWETTFRVVREIVEGGDYGPAPGPRPRPPAEGRRVRSARTVVRLPVARPRVMLAFKDRPIFEGGRALLRREILTAVALDLLLGNSGTIYAELYEKGLVDETFSCSYSAEPGYAFALFGGETDDPSRLVREIGRRLREAPRRGVTEEEFERVRNKAMGDYARAFNSPESIAQMLVSHHLRGTRISDYARELRGLRRSELQGRLRELLHPASRAVSLVLPR